MKRTIETKFFTFDQNNSGGYFVKNTDFGVGEYVIIEAVDANDAINRLETIGENVSGFDAFCGCCSERWIKWLDDSDGTKEPKIYGKSPEDYDSYSKGTAYIHYFDGTIKAVKLK